MTQGKKAWVPPTDAQWLQWRLDFARHLKGERLQFLKWTARNRGVDHDHCAACWAKFADFEGPDIQHYGYATCDDYKHGALYHWVCRKCFNDLRDIMGWTVVANSVTPRD